jgi:hypothetical protein
MKEKKNRTCPVCEHTFKPMTDEHWKMVLFEHLTLSEKHQISQNEAQKYIT